MPVPVAPGPAEHSFGAVVYRKKRGEVYFLLLKHLSGNHWSLAKGHPEPGETEEQTALREIVEETGLTVKLKPGFRAVTRYTVRKGVEKEVVFYLAKSARGRVKVQHAEISNACWLELEDALRLVTHADTGEVIRQASVFLAN